jgi:hypothetical protein
MFLFTQAEFFTVLRVLYFRNWSVTEEDILKLPAVQADMPNYAHLKHQMKTNVEQFQKAVFGQNLLLFVEREVAAFNRATGIADHVQGKPLAIL